MALNILLVALSGGGRASPPSRIDHRRVGRSYWSVQQGRSRQAAIHRSRRTKYINPRTPKNLSPPRGGHGHGLSPGVWNVWPRLAASGRRLAGVWTSGRLGVWGTSGSRLVHIWARLERLGLYHLRTTSRHVWARLGTSGHVWARLDV
eukprot:2402940-Prymnesium_polylepis.1